MKANEVRLQEMNQIATALTSVGQTETAVRIRQQIDDLNQRWKALEQRTEQREQVCQQSVPKNKKYAATWVRPRSAALSP